MTTKELIGLLRKLDRKGSMEVIELRYSDYRKMREDDWVVNGAVDRGEGAGYLMRSHNTMSEIDKAKEKPYVLFKGN